MIPGTAQRFRSHVISTITTRGQVTFMVFRGRFTTPVFLRRLLPHAPGRLYHILDRHPVHVVPAVARWVVQRGDCFQLFFLPSYSPDLNLDAFLNNDVKSNALGRRRPADVDDLFTDVRAYLRSIQRQPAILLSYFRAPSVQYADL